MYTPENKGTYTPSPRAYILLHEKGYTYVESESIFDMAADRSYDEHGPMEHLCTNCIDWATTEFLLNKLEAALV